MLTYLARRLLLTVPTLFIVTVIVFVMIRLVPGDAVDAMAMRLSQQGRAGQAHLGEHGRHRPVLGQGVRAGFAPHARRQ